MLAEAGLDIAHAFDPALLGSSVPATTHRRALLVGNTRALWEPFLAALAADPVLAAAADPLERYVELAIARAFGNAPAWFSHRRYDRDGTRSAGHDGAFLPFQRIAVAAGLGVLAPTQLVIHPVYGPWFALRAIVLVDGEPPPPPVPPALQCCNGACVARLDAAVGSGDWRAWLAVRDACNVGRAYRYSDRQITYHYTKNRDLLFA